MLLLTLHFHKHYRYSYWFIVTGVILVTGLCLHRGFFIEREEVNKEAFDVSLRGKKVGSTNLNSPAIWHYFDFLTYRFYYRL